MYHDLTQGNITQGLLRFALPMIAGDLLQQFYNIADTLIVGRALGRDALAAVVRAEDGRIAPTVLHDAVFEALQVGAVRELIGKIYAPGFGKREVAALAPLVGAAAEQGDAAALQIVEKAGRELALLVRPVAEKLGLQSARIAFAGSVLQKCAPVRSAAQTQLQTLLPQLTLAEPQGDAAAGAVLLARCKAEE